MSGNRSERSYRSRSPKRLTVPVPVRSCLGVPCSSTRLSRSSYWVSIGPSLVLATASDYGRGRTAGRDTRPLGSAPAPPVRLVTVEWWGALGAVVGGLLLW